MRRLFLILGFVLALVVAMPVSAQQGMVLDSIQVQFWPEYDSPAMLVIYTIELPADAALPVEVRVPIPAAAGTPHAVAVAIGGELVTREYTREVNGDWAEIVVQADSSIVHVEYYDPGMVFNEASRSFEYVWPGAYATNAFIVRVQTPAKASNMSFSAEMGSAQVAEDSLSYYSRSFGALAAGEQFLFSIRYSNSSGQLTSDVLANTTPWWIWLLVGFGVVLIGLGGWFFLSDSKKNAKKGQSKYAKKQNRSAKPVRQPGKPAGFCHNCGSPTQTGDKFCRECGEKLRV